MSAQAAAKPGTPSSPDSTIVKSVWDGLNPNLVAVISTVKKEENRWVWAKDAPWLVGLLSEANMEVQLGWRSPFENSNPENMAPTVAAMAKSGALQPLMEQLGVGKYTGQTLGDLEGRTGVTKLNSTQVFDSMVPMKITGTLIFRAWKDAAQEVEAPLAQLMSWALPQKLSSDGLLLGRAVQGAKGELSKTDVLMPSWSPVVVGMRYKGRSMRGLVIESVGIPLDSPIDKKGRFVQLRIPITLCTLSAIDREDWKGYGPL